MERCKVVPFLLYTILYLKLFMPFLTLVSRCHRQLSLLALSDPINKKPLSGLPKWL